MKERGRSLPSESEAIALVESIVWPTGPICPGCGNADASKLYRLKGPSVRPGLIQCGYCRRQFTVKAATVLRNSKVSLGAWLEAAQLLDELDSELSVMKLYGEMDVGYRCASRILRTLRREREGFFAQVLARTATRTAVRPAAAGSPCLASPGAST